MEAALDWEDDDVISILRNHHPYFTLNNLRLRELEELLYVFGNKE